MNFVFTCGGTAGHINPAIALAESLKAQLPDAGILFIGSGRALENRLIPMAGFQIENVSSSGFERSFSPRAILENLISVKNLVAADIQVRRIFKRFRPDAAIGTGGYVCYPVLKRAARMGIPTLIHEANAMPGLTTKMLCGVVDKVLVSFPDVAEYYKYPEKVVMTGMPVKADFAAVSRSEARRKMGLEEDTPLVVSFWGSLGADRMNGVMADFIARNARDRMFRHIHATGSDSDGVEGMLSLLRERGITDANIPCTELRPYIDDMPVVMAAANLILCRAGASTLGELQLMAKPAVLVPSPYVTNDHQTKNAEHLQQAGGAVVLRESECTGDTLYETVTTLLSSPARLREMSDALREIAVTDTNERIIKMILSMCKN